MNNKELTEKIKKDITGILEEKSDLKLATSYYDSRVEGINAIVDYIIKTTQSNDEIKREAVEELHNFVRSNTIGGRFMNDSGGYFNADAVLREDIEQYLAERKS